MEDKLFNASMEFVRTCDKRLEEKEKAGWVGWDKYVFKGRYKGKIRLLSRKQKLTQEDLVDISNYCMFLWNLIEKRKGDSKDGNNR